MYEKTNQKTIPWFNALWDKLTALNTSVTDKATAYFAGIGTFSVSVTDIESFFQTFGVILGVTYTLYRFWNDIKANNKSKKECDQCEKE